MRRQVAASICAVALSAIALPVALAAPPIKLPALTRIASKLAGLPAKHKVDARVVSGAAIEREAVRLLDREYPRDQQAYDQSLYRALGLLEPGQSLRPALIRAQVHGVRGLYDPQRRIVYVRRGAGVNEALVHELVHALQDQSFNLRRLSGLRRGSRDAGLGAVAAVEGSAMFSAFGGGDGGAGARTTSAEEDSPLDFFLEIESEFPYATGARFAEVLQNVGGRPAVHGALRRFPETTEQIFHVDAFLARQEPLPILVPEEAAGFRFVRDDTFGELDVRALLAVFQVPRLDRVGEGWGGGRSALYRDGSGAEAVAVVLAWDEERDAAEWAEAVETYMNEAFDAEVPGRPAKSACAAQACWELDGRAIAFARDGLRTALVFGTSLAESARLAESL